MAAAVGRDIEEIYRTANRGVLSEVELLQQITEACRDCVSEFVKGECFTLKLHFFSLPLLPTLLCRHSLLHSFSSRHKPHNT